MHLQRATQRRLCTERSSMLDVKIRLSAARKTHQLLLPPHSHIQCGDSRHSSCEVDTKRRLCTERSARGVDTQMVCVCAFQNALVVAFPSFSTHTHTHTHNTDHHDHHTSSHSHLLRLSFIFWVVCCVCCPTHVRQKAKKKGGADTRCAVVHSPSTKKTNRETCTVELTTSLHLLLHLLQPPSSIFFLRVQRQSHTITEHLCTHTHKRVASDENTHTHTHTHTRPRSKFFFRSFSFFHPKKKEPLRCRQGEKKKRCR